MKLEIHADIHLHSHGSEKDMLQMLHKLDEIIKAVSISKEYQKTINSETEEINRASDELKKSVDLNTPQ